VLKFGYVIDKNFFTMLQPKRTRFRKFQKGRCGGIRNNLQELHFGCYGIKTLEAGKLSAKVIEALRRTLTKAFKRKARIWIRVFPDIAVSRKPSEVRMGKGKGANDHWICRVQAGHILFEMDGIPYAIAKYATTLANTKSPFPLQLISKK
jgi:large subunit ribosomal protein L16